jgi:hypothetical protein
MLAMFVFFVSFSLLVIVMAWSVVAQGRRLQKTTDAHDNPELRA